MTTTNEPTILLIPGHWLGAWAWDDVVNHLTAAGRRAIAMTLPGLDESDPDRKTRTLDEQAEAIAQAAAAEALPVVVVAHSGANAPVSLVLDQNPGLIHHVIWVDSGPAAPGSVFAPTLPLDTEELPLPPFGTLQEQASLEGLSDAVLERFRRRAVPEPAPVLRQRVDLTNDARLQIPTTLICCSIESAQMMELADAGHPMFAEVAHLKHRELVDLPTGHWPMWSRPGDLARLIDEATTGRADEAARVRSKG